MSDQVDLDELDEDEHDRAWLHGRPFSGEAVETYPNGRPASMTTYHDGYEDGPQRFWRDDGSLESECTLRRGNAVGKTETWHRSGALAEEKMFDDRGRPLWWRSWDEDGHVVGEGDWDEVYGPRAGGPTAATGR